MLPYTKQRGMERDNPREHIVVRARRRTVVVDCEEIDDVIAALQEAAESTAFGEEQSK